MSELIKVFSFTAEQAHSFAKEQSVAGEPIVIGDVTVIPISKLSCGFAGGGSDRVPEKQKDGVMAGAGVKITKTPLSFLAVCGSEVQVLHVAGEQKKYLLASLTPLVAQFKEKLAAKKAEKDGAAE